MPKVSHIGNPSHKNVQAVAEIERQALEERSGSDRLSDAISHIAGSVGFALVQVCVCGVWIIVNTGYLPGIQPFDPFPFSFLTMVVSLEAICLSIFVLMSQNRMTRHADRRAHLNLQVNLLEEQELTTMLELQRAICMKLGIDVDSRVRPFLKDMDVQELVAVLEDGLPTKHADPS